MKKLMNQSEGVVAESLRGLELAHPSLIRVVPKPLFVIARAAPVKGKVGIVSGGGSGHDPLHAGFVGTGMLDAAVPGPVFTSPNPLQIAAAGRAVDGGAGVLFIVKNYTGDVMNFEAAAEELQEDGLKVSTVIVADDVSIAKGSATAGRRGVGGTVFVEKIAGAAAQRGDSLEEVTRIAAEAASRVRSMGVALSAGSLFHSPEPTFQLPEGEIEVGIGIHGEAGRFRSAFLSSKETVAALLGPIFEEIDGKEPLLVMVNGMGATTLPELHIAFADACDWIAARGRQVGASLVGNYVTSTDMAGFSISVLPLTEEFAELWRAPVATPALQGVA